MVLFFLLVPLLLPLTVAAESQPVSVQLKEFSVQSDPKTFQSGEVRFVAVNKGSEEHELVIRRKEKGGFKDLGEIEPFASGLTKEVTLNLTSGTYELSCQIIEKEGGETVDHYKKGMRAEIEVK